MSADRFRNPELAPLHAVDRVGALVLARVDVTERRHGDPCKRLEESTRTHGTLDHLRKGNPVKPRVTAGPVDIDADPGHAIHPECVLDVVEEELPGGPATLHAPETERATVQGELVDERIGPVHLLHRTVEVHEIRDLVTIAAEEHH